LLNRFLGFWQVLKDLLVDWGPVGEVKGRLAESWEISDDGLEWTFHLVDMDVVVFHDGTALTAEDIAWVLEYYAGNEAISWALGAASNVFTLSSSNDRDMSAY